MARFGELSKRKAQSSLEVALVLIGIAVLVTAVARSWSWVNRGMVDRLSSYKNSRVVAGSDNPGVAIDYQGKKLTIVK
ncbi:MAG: hypothetical protein PHU91_00740 [Candidatus Omnitrophica bacterium]|nr:hypothetical protein [Candidatus Omnitrophota bacterium]MDD5236186.1 hypothetical protein [Candidatus Omnitrophota bacterium]MDD5610827.1 hypothetical protein [Candidatus Omnitrophota bacterium]